MREIVVSDTNIFIDLFDVGMLEKFCKLPCAIHTTDLVAAEISSKGLKEAMEHLFAEGAITKKSFTPTEIEAINSLRRRNLSFTDCSVLYYAKTCGLELLTGDGRLRKTAEEMGVEVMGVIGVMDELLSTGLIERNAYVASLKRLLEINPRIPKKPVFERLGED